MANTWGDARKMARVCAENGVQLTFNHQRRFGKPARKAKAMLDEGQIGELARLEFGRFNLCDYGTHQFDMCNYFNDQAPVEWVIGQIDYRSERRVFGEHQENQALVMWRYGNGVLGLCATSDSGGLMGAHDRMIGTDGIIEIEPSGEAMPVLRVLRKGDADWETVDTEGESHHGPGFVERAIADILHHLEEGTTSELCAENALQATEIIFAAWESSRRRGRVDLPLQIEDNPLASMVESGELSPDPRE
jgi:predicted dehydrogenase